MRIHSEDKTELLPWLMPEVVGRVFTGGFSVDAKNKLISETRVQASSFAGDLVRKATGEAQRSAARTLTMLAQGLGADAGRFRFHARRANSIPRWTPPSWNRSCRTRTRSAKEGSDMRRTVVGVMGGSRGR